MNKNQTSTDPRDRFVRTKSLLGERCFARISGAHIAVIGLGAVGGYVVEGLARAGIGRLTLADFDTVQLSNINRQIYALESTLGQPKTELAKKRVLDINPACAVESLHLFVDEESVLRIFSRQPDIVVDAIDSLNPKVQLLYQAIQHQFPVFSSMGAALRTDPTQIRIADISATHGCPLAKRVRKRLRRRNIESGITCVYSSENIDFLYDNTSTAADTGAGQNLRGRSRNILGSLPTITALFGLILANSVIQSLCETVS